ncbi:MAG TPA: signal peptidase II [Candidatus Acidoferrales bacterium]|nr:signal peptidase II [Candidatus Acidoferrales bacterium]
MTKAQARASLFGLSLLIVILDRATKMWVASHVELYFGSITIIPRLFSITHVENPGAAFSLLANASPTLRSAVLITFSTLAMIVVAFVLWRTGREWNTLNAGLALVLGGAVGNLWDRVIRHRVTDFFHLYIGNWSWPDFNVADSAIVVGACLLMFQILFVKSSSTSTA